MKQTKNNPVKETLPQKILYCRPAILIAGLCLILCFTGCNQRRYKPAKWRAGARKSTLPTATPTGQWATLPSGSTLPRGMGSTLPNAWRSGAWSTLPYSGSTLPGRRGGNWSTLPNNWSTLPGRGGSTLPVNLRQRDWDAWPRGRGPSGSTLPRRWESGGGTTLPKRWIPNQRLRRSGSTLPNNPLR